MMRNIASKFIAVALMATAFFFSVLHKVKDSDRLQAHEYEEYLDVDSCIDYMIVEELTNNTDFYNTWLCPNLFKHVGRRNEDAVLSGTYQGS